MGQNSDTEDNEELEFDQIVAEAMVKTESALKLKSCLKVVKTEEPELTMISTHCTEPSYMGSTMKQELICGEKLQERKEQIIAKYQAKIAEAEMDYKEVLFKQKKVIAYYKNASLKTKAYIVSNSTLVKSGGNGMIFQYPEKYDECIDGNLAKLESLVQVDVDYYANRKEKIKRKETEVMARIEQKLNVANMAYNQVVSDIFDGKSPLEEKGEIGVEWVELDSNLNEIEPR